MAAVSAGILLYRRGAAGVEVFLVHPGGPFWARKDEGAWSVPKGLVDPGEQELACALREFREETGFEPGHGASARDLGSFRQPSGKRLHVWALEGDCDPEALHSNLFEMEWPPKSARMASFPEVDRGAWCGRAEALRRISRGQAAIIDKFYAEGG